jgi:mono/diheme cytochrome c family protein
MTEWKLDLVLLFGAVFCASSASAAPSGDAGRREFLNKCAACHGSGGRGDGPVAESLRVPPSDLTTLSKRNGGVFPRDRVYATIDGRDMVRAHGTREMPVWGNVLAAEGSGGTRSSSDAPVDMATEVRSRIRLLVGYLERIQAR